MKQLTSLVLVSFLAILPAAAFEPQADNLVQPLGSGVQILIAVAGNAEGAVGTHFRSEILIINYRDVDQEVQLFWIPRSGPPFVITVTINARSGLGSSDFIGEVLGQTGLGTLVLTPMITGTNNTDTNARLYATARIWTPQPGTTGTTSQTLSTVPLAHVSGRRLSMVGLRRDEQYRLNVGVMNLDNDRTQTFVITVGGNNPLVTESETITLPPLSMQQVGMHGQALANLQVAVDNVTPDETLATRWFAYGSSVDNITGDSWSMLGFERPEVAP
ncbi:MAG TPA: hypothetical protein VNA04_10515 [Thermoanaerobaculia bacterium]|nr:hypothetical protein [Thermoanaerobaculia bacterium]